MGLFSSSTPEPVEDHGHGLLQELEDWMANMRQRIATRRDVVHGRMAALESEAQALDTADAKLPAKSA